MLFPIFRILFFPSSFPPPCLNGACQFLVNEHVVDVIHGGCLCIFRKCQYIPSLQREISIVEILGSFSSQKLENIHDLHP